MYWFACCNISGTIVDGYSISDQKNQEGRSPIKNAWIASEGLALGIARILIAKRPTGEGFLTSLSEVEERCGPTRSYCSTRATTVATSPLLRHRSSLPKAISLLNHYNISSSLLPPLVVHSSVAIASDRHILLKGRHLCCLAYHNATFSSSNSSRTLLCNSRRLCPAALYLSFSLLLSSSSTTTTTTSFSPPAAIIVAQPYPR
ncbi:hypothetical protein BHE74_00006925 [Ensete ventricosum]|nr:hypothetical protein BHE74_00006925 [Ensete ventricosum]